MQRKIYLTGIEKRCGKSFVSLGFVTTLLDQKQNVYPYKLFSEVDNVQIPLLEALTHRKIKPLMDINRGITRWRQDEEELTGMVFEATACHDPAVLQYFEGTDFESDNDAFEFQYNLALASQLNAEVVLVISAKERTLHHLTTLITAALEGAKKAHANVVGVIINRLNGDEAHALAYFKKRFKALTLLAVIPEFDILANPTMADIAHKLQARILCGHKELLRPVKQITIAAKTVGNFLESRVNREGMLILTPYDRVDILLGSLLADQSANYPKIAGIVLTGGQLPDSVIYEIISGLEQPFPVLLTRFKTYDTATTLYTAKYSLNQNNQRKVDESIEATRPYLFEPMQQLLKQQQPVNRLNPAVFLYELMGRAKQVKRHIVLPEGDDPRILKAAAVLLKRKVVDITLLGDPKKIHLLAKRLDLDLSALQIIDVEKSPLREQYAQQYFQLRQHKNVNLPIALERLTDVNYFAAMMVYNNDADGMVSGADHTTADTVRPALEIIKTKPGVSKVSSVFIMCLPSRVIIYGDCAINPEPDSAMLAEIALQAVDIANKLGIEPKVALLSYSSGGSGKGESVEKVAKAMDLIRVKSPSLLAEGPIQYDAAVDWEVARKKLPDSKLAGDASVLIFPDLNTGNNTYKAVQRETGALAIGPVLLGLNKPVNDLSRGCTPQDIINTILITAIQVEGKSS